MQRHACLVKGCHATFEASPARDGEARHCNRTGPDGGHVHLWDGQQWRPAAGAMQHDRK